MNENKAPKALIISILAVVILSLCLTVTTVALTYLTVQVEENKFTTGTVAINLNDGKPVITADEFLFEPGMTVVKDFFIENLSTCDVYYRLYFNEVKGSLATVLQISISCGETVLWEGTAATLSKANVAAADDVLKFNERREMTITFHYPEASGNETQNNYLTFDFCAEAVQTLNNPDKTFN